MNFRLIILQIYSQRAQSILYHEERVLDIACEIWDNIQVEVSILWNYASRRLDHDDFDIDRLLLCVDMTHTTKKAEHYL